MADARVGPSDLLLQCYLLPLCASLHSKPIICVFHVLCVCCAFLHEYITQSPITGMTNRKDMIDEALVRPGRLEVQMEISLPDEAGRVQILDIHTSKIKENDKLASDVDIQELAEKTKNFSGAELAGLVRSAASTAMNRHIKVWANRLLL